MFIERVQRIQIQGAARPPGHPVVIPIQRLSLVFRVYVNTLLNDNYEAVGGRVWAGTVIAFIGAVALSLSTDVVLGLYDYPGWLRSALMWRWPAP